VTTGEAGCAVSDTVVVLRQESIDLQLPTHVDVDLCADPYVVIGPSIALPAGVEPQWSTGAGTPTIMVDTPGAYTLQVQGDGYCATQGTVEVRDVCIVPDYLPNAFTPNGDGINDTWHPVSNASAGPSTWSIHDRWGR
jgi:hypothetical protein